MIKDNKKRWRRNRELQPRNKLPLAVKRRMMMNNCRENKNLSAKGRRNASKKSGKRMKRSKLGMRSKRSSKGQERRKSASYFKRDRSVKDKENLKSSKERKN